MPKKYLYGAAVHSIQNFIFETGRLKEIVGASELVEQICSRLFREELGSNYNSDNLILSAAGKIIYRFDQDTGDCQKIVKTYPKLIKQLAPSIQFSQAVIEIKETGTKEELNKLDDLLDTQRNRTTPQHGLGLMITERARRTGRAGFKKDKDAEEKDALIDRTQDTKLYFFEHHGVNLLKKIMPEEKKCRFPEKIDDITPNKEWLAIVHADGNSLGKSIQTILKEERVDIISFYKKFSSNLNKATEDATKEAYNKSVQPKIEAEEIIPLQPILLGGDDLTIIIRADLALDFTANYLEAFQKHTKKQFENMKFPKKVAHLKDGLTACAGIAFIKPNYPFHYGTDLAEDLTKYAKKVAKAKAKATNKKIPPSCLAFHKVQSSFISAEGYKGIIKQELTAKPDTLSRGIQFNYGPYFLTTQSSYATVSSLQAWVRSLQKADAPKSNLREWLSELQTNEAGAAQMLERLRDLNPRFREELCLGNDKIAIKREGTRFTHIYDALIIDSISRLP